MVTNETITILTRLLELRTEIKAESLRKCKQEIHSSDFQKFQNETDPITSDSQCLSDHFRCLFDRKIVTVTYASDSENSGHEKIEIIFHVKKSGKFVTFSEYVSEV